MTKTFGSKAQGLSWDPHVQSSNHVILAQYNIITCYVRRNRSTPYAARKEKKPGKDTQLAATGDDDKDKK